MARRRPWLDLLAALLEQQGERFALSLWESLYESLLADGMHWRTAARIALRGTRLATYLLNGMEQRQAASVLNVSERTAKYDVQRIRRVIASRTATGARGSSIARVPLRPDELPVHRRRRL